MKHSTNYRSTIFGCYLANFVQSIVINLTAILFIPLREMYGLSLATLGVLAAINFITQVVADLAFSKSVDKHGFRVFMVAAPLLALAGFTVFLSAPLLFPVKPIIGFVIGTIIFSCAGGLLELLLSPVINAIPSKEKEKAMSVLHSFYAWGQLTVIIITTLLLKLVGKEHWQFIVLFWCLAPAICAFVFTRVPMPSTIEHEHQTPNKTIAKNPYFILGIALIMCGGASEQIAAQWTSSFFEIGLNFSKTTGDLVGVGFFALVFASCRLWYGKKSSAVPILKAMQVGTLICCLSFVTFAFSPFPALTVFAAGLCGIGVSLLWPGTVAFCASLFPMAGTWLFAMLAFAGDVGCALGPWSSGIVAQTVQSGNLLSESFLFLSRESLGLRTGMLAGIVFPLAAFFIVSRLRRLQELPNLNPAETTRD